MIPSKDDIEQRLFEIHEKDVREAQAPSYHIDHVDLKASFTYFGNDLVLEFICEGIADTPIRLSIESHVVTTMHNMIVQAYESCLMHQTPKDESIDGYVRLEEPQS